MKNTITIGVAALLAGAAGGYLAGKGSVSPETSAEVASVGKESRSSARGGAAGSNDRSARKRDLADILNEPGQLARMQSLMELYANMTPDELKAEAEKLDRMPMAQRLMASFLLFGRWGETDPQGALAHANTMGFGGMFVRPTILQSWASVDPENAAKYFSENPREFAAMGFGRGGPMGGEGGASVIAAEWAKLDPDAALAWANSLSGEQDKSGAVQSVVREMAAKDPKRAAEIAATLTGDDQNRAYSEIAQQWAATNFSEAKAWIDSLPAEARERAMASALSSYASENPSAAAAEVASLADGRAKDRAIEEVAQAWARKDPAAAASWVAQQQTEDADDAIRGVMMNWAATDSGAALSFINGLDAGEMRDEAVSSYLFANRSAEPAERLELAGTISDNGDRNRAVMMTYMQWMREDSDAARASIQSSPLIDEGMKERLLSGRGFGGPGGPGGRGRGNRGGGN